MRPIDHAMHIVGSFLVEQKLISKSNHKGRTPYLPKKYRDFETGIAYKALEAFRRPMLESGWVIIKPVFATRTHADLNNLPKSILDALVKGGVFKDDKTVAVTVCPAEYGKDRKSIIEVWS